MRPNLLPRGTERRDLRLGTAVLWIFLSAIAVAAAVFIAMWDLLSTQGLKPEPRLSADTLFDLVKLSFGVVAGAGALVALVVAYRRQRVDEDGALRESTRLHTERFTAAVSQLGADSAAVRLGGVHALTGLADDAPTRKLRQTCIDVLCAYLRLPYTAETDLPHGDADARHTYLALREVRHTVIRLIRDHLRLWPDHHPDSWQGYDLDFTGVVFDGGDFAGAVFSGGTVSFKDAMFCGGRVNFDGADFSGSTADFSGAEFSGGMVCFDEAVFSGGKVRFVDTVFSGGTVSFNAAKFSGSLVRLSNTVFSGGTVSFNDAEFSGSLVIFTTVVFSSGTISFSRTKVTGGNVTFRNTEFSGSLVCFRSAVFSGGEVELKYARFSGSTVDFNNAEFSGGRVRFSRAVFSGGRVDFHGAEFSDSGVDFADAEYTGGRVDFSASAGAMPAGLPAMGSQPHPDGLTLPHAWLSLTP
ncbi:pentapeptide repeat-containing protein [Streptomyces sp. NPDC059218]|uniref:pentapeptide repeat-containing protein n=1 Tax=unclassified Streptomyces TaxID=2593676 RepID=UPI0036A56FFC